MALGLPSPLAARAELPPWAYAEQQRQAPVVVELEVLRAAQVASQWQVLGRVVKVIRQPSTGRLHSNQRLIIRYPLPEGRSAGMVGPAPVPLLHRGEKVRAWIQPLPGELGNFAPAAGGRSFGPPMEEVVEPK
ncbi:MAG: hypothetical protein VKN56_04680 [Cyanobacteriota bacterium]|nr:hypothetical protein [Cyanobacteriota bacterium]